MMDVVKNFFRQKRLGSKAGIGITEVLIAAAILGFMCIALNKLQTGNHETLLRLRGRDGAVEVAQRVLDSLKSVGSSALPSDSDPTKDLTYTIGDVERRWERGLGGYASITYTPEITVFATQDYKTENKSAYESTKESEPPASHIYAKQVDVKVSWKFKGSDQSINVSGVIR